MLGVLEIIGVGGGNYVLSDFFHAQRERIRGHHEAVHGQLEMRAHSPAFLLLILEEFRVHVLGQGLAQPFDERQALLQLLPGAQHQGRRVRRQALDVPQTRERVLDHLHAGHQVGLLGGEFVVHLHRNRVLLSDRLRDLHGNADGAEGLRRKDEMAAC